MMDDIAAIQSRVADIQSRLAALNGGVGPQTGSMTPSAPASTTGQGGSFEQVLAGERARYGTVGQSTATPASVSAMLPPERPGVSVPAASLGPLPEGTRPAVAGETAPLAPAQDTIVPIQTGSASGVSEYEPIIDRCAAANGVPPALVRAVIKTESDGNPRSVSRAGAMGLMQLMPDNVREAGIDDPFDPTQNISAGTKQLAGLLNRYHGDIDLALAGYNAGPGNVAKYGGVPPFRETQNYIKKVRSAMGENN